VESLRGNCFNGFFDAAEFERVGLARLFVESWAILGVELRNKRKEELWRGEKLWSFFVIIVFMW